MSSPNQSRNEGSHIGKTIRVKGELQSEHDVLIDGKFEGVVRLAGQCLTIGPNGDLSADITAQEVVVHGKLKGNVEAKDRIEIGRTGSVWGDLAMARISIHDGAFFQGRVNIRVDGRGNEGPRTAAAPPVAASRPATATDSQVQAPLLEPRR